MPNYTNIPFIWPFKMIRLSSTSGIHFDDRWSLSQVKPWQMRIPYFQKWKRSDTTKLQIESSVLPSGLKVIDENGATIKTFNWAVAFAGTGYTIYETTYDVSDVTQSKIFLSQVSNLGFVEVRWISEPIKLAADWPGTLLYTYRNTYNKDGMAWTTGVSMSFRVESWICPLIEVKRIRAAYINQLRGVETRSSTAYRIHKLYIGNTNLDVGVAPWVIDLMNRIFGCDTISIGETLATSKKYQSDEGSEWETWKVNTYSLMAAMIDICTEENATSSQQAVGEDDVTPAIMVVYQIRGRFFSGEQAAQVIDIETL